MKIEIGVRVGALRDADKQTVNLFGYGTYQGDEVPPDDVMGLFGRPGLLHRRNPKIVLDSGVVIWGCESWWCPEERIKAIIGSRTVVLVDPVRTPPTEKERTEVREIMAAVGPQVNEIVGAWKDRLDK